MPCTFNMPAKIMTGVSVVTCVIGLIVYAMAGNKVEGVGEDVEFVIEEQSSFTVNIPDTAHFATSYAVWIEGNPNDGACTSNSCTVTHVASSKAGDCNKDCSNSVQGPGQLAHEPVLQNLCSFGYISEVDPSNSSQVIEFKGDYQVVCTAEAWVIEEWEQLGNIIGDVAGGIGLALIAYVIIIGGSICACVACCLCCCGNQEQQGGKTGGGVVIGQPVAAS